MALNVLSLTAEQILQIDKQDPEKLFSMEGFVTEFNKLRGHWHPDRNHHPLASRVLARINQLADTAEEKIESNTWNGPALLTFTSKAGKTFNFRYKKSHSFELGQMYIATTRVMFVVTKNNKDLFDNGIKSIKSIKYQDKLFEKEFKRFLPTIVFEGETDIGLILIVEKQEDTVLLQDLIDYLPDNQIPPKHVAWIVSSLYNLAVFLEHSELCHNSILPSTVFVDAKNHGCMLLGGWWYSTKTKGKLIALPKELLRILPKVILENKVGETVYDRCAIKGLAIGCLGDNTLIGSKLLMRKDIPTPFLNWIRSPSIYPALEEYWGWSKTLDKSFGKRKFITLDFNINDVY